MKELAFCIALFLSVTAQLDEYYANSTQLVDRCGVPFYQHFTDTTIPEEFDTLFNYTDVWTELGYVFTTTENASTIWFETATFQMYSGCDEDHGVEIGANIWILETGGDATNEDVWDLQITSDDTFTIWHDTIDSVFNFTFSSAENMNQLVANSTYIFEIEMLNRGICESTNVPTIWSNNSDTPYGHTFYSWVYPSIDFSLNQDNLPIEMVYDGVSTNQILNPLITLCLDATPPTNSPTRAPSLAPTIDVSTTDLFFDVSTTTTSKDDDGSNLSTGVIVGIIVGVAACVCITAIIGIILCRRDKEEEEEEKEKEDKKDAATTPHKREDAPLVNVYEV